MPQQVRRRKQIDIQYQENSKQSERLSRGMVYREMYLNLTGQLELIGPANEPLAFMQGDEWGVVKRIDIIANNTQVIRSISGNQLWWLNQKLYGVDPILSIEMANLSADPKISATLVLPFWLPRSVRPLDTALDARELSDLKIEVTWGDMNSVNGDAVGWVIPPNLAVHSLECFNINRTFSQWRNYDIVQTVTASSPSFQVILPVGPMYRGFLINTTARQGGIISDNPDILQNLKIKSGTTVYADVPAFLMNHIDGGTRIGLGKSLDSATGLYNGNRKGAANDSDAWYYYDHVTDGYLSESIDTLGFSEFELELDVHMPGGSDPVEIHVMPQQIIPVRGVSQKV